MKDVQEFEFKFKFNAQESKKQLKSISNDVLQMIHDMDTASNKMKVFTNFVGYLEKLDGALDQFKADHKNDFKNMFGDIDSQLTKSLESALGLSPKQLGQLSELRSRIDGAFANKANTEELRKIAQDINALFDAIGRPAELDIDGLFSGKGNLNERIGALNNALYKFYLQYQLITNSIQNGFASGGMQGFTGLSEEVQKEVKRLSDAYDELITVQQKLQKAQSDIDKIHTKNNKKVVEQYKIELNEESVSQLMTEFDLLNAQLESGDSSSKEYYENLLKMTDVILKLNSALKTIRDDKSLLTTFQGISVGGGYSHMFDKLSKYTTQKATQFENNFLGKTLTDGIAELMLSSRTQIEKLILGNTGRLIGGSGSGSGNGSGNGDGEKQVSLYKQLVSSLKEYKKAYAEYKALEDAGADEDELESKGDYIDELKEKIYQLVNLSEEASDAASDIFNVYENGKYNFNQLVDELTKVLGITKEINEEGSGKKLKTYEELLKIFDKLNALGLDETDFADSNVQKLVKDLKDLYAAEEQLEDVDNILHGLIDGEIDDITALNKLTTLFGIEIPDGVKIAAQKIDDFYDKIKSQHALGLESEFSAGEYKSEMELLKNELQELREQGRITESQFEDIEKAFDRDVQGYVNTFIGRNNVLSELNKLNKDASLTDEESALEAIVQKRREILAAAEQNGTLLDEQLSEEKAITDEIEKRIGLKKQDGQGNGQGSGSGGSGTGSDNGSGTGSGDAADENEQYQKLLGTINLVTQAVNEKTAAFVTEKNTVDEVVEQEIEALERLSGYLDTIKTTAQSVFGTKQGIVNSSVKEWQQALESIYNTMQSISNMQSVEEMLSRMAANALDIKNNLNVSSDSSNIGSGANRAETITNVDFTSLEGTIKSEIASLIGKLDNVLKVEVVKSDAEEIKSAIGGVQKSIDSIATTINDYKAKNVNSQQQAQIDAMKNNLLQLQKFVSNFNSRIVDGKYQQQEITGAILSDGSISVGYGEKGEVPWDRVASSLVANLTKSLVVDLHSHPLKQLSTGQMYANDAFSGSSGDLSAFSFSKELGAKLAAEITGNVMRVLDLSKLSETQMMSLSGRLRDIEIDYAKRPEYSKYIVHEDGKIKYNQQSTLQGQHQVTQILESMMYEAFKRMGYSKEKVDKELFKKYDLTDDQQLTELASKLVQLTNASQSAIEPLNRLKQIVSLFDGNLGSSEAKTAFDAFTKGELSAADVFNQLNGKGYKISQETMDSLFRINSANEIPAIESLLNQVTSVLNTISSSVSSIDGKINTNTGTKFDYALNDLMEFSGLNDVGTEITKRITSTVKSKFDPSNVSEYKAQELSLNALNKAQDLINNFEYVESKNGQISVERTQVMLDNFVSTLRAMEDAMNQVDLYRERTGKKVLNDQGKNIEDDLVTTFYATFNKTNIQAMRDLLARGKEKWQAKKDSYGDGAGTKVDPTAQNIDSLTTAVGELQNVVNGLQQFIASPQFTIKADTSALEESLSNVATEINTGAQRIADAVNEFGSRDSTPTEYGQVSIDKNEITAAMKEALYAKELAANYAKVEFHDVMEYDWRLDQYTDALTGEIVGAFEEADKYFDAHFSDFYKSLDGSFVGNKELAIEHLIQNQSKDNDFATVIVQAIQDQTGKIVNAIKVVLPESISSNRSSNGELVNEEKIANAFKIVAQRASNWSNANYDEPRGFFNDILSGSMYLDDELRYALKDLGMLSSGGVPKFKVASEGLRNLGVAIGQDFALPSRPIDLDQVRELTPLLNEATKLGAAIPRIVSSFNDADRVFELQTKMKGDNIRSSFNWLNATVEQIDGFIHTLETLNKVGLYPDFIGDNVLFDEQNGFSLVDIETQPLKWGLDSAEDMGNWFVQYLNRLGSKYEFSGQESEFERFIDLFEYRMSLSPEQRFVNEDTIAQRSSGTTPNESANMSGFDASIDKLSLAATALNDAAVRLGNVADSLVNGPSGAPNAEIDIYDPYEYQERKVLHFGELYDQEDDMSKKAIDDLALFTREYDQLWDIMTKEPIDIFDTAYPTDAEKAQILDIFEQIKQKNLEISNNSFVTEEELQRLRQLKAEVKGLQNELKGASLGFGFAEDYWENYRDIYGLGNFDAQMFADYIHGDDMHSSFTGQLSNMLQDKMVKVDRMVSSDEIDDALIRGTKEFNQFLAEHAKKLLGEQSIFDPANVGYQQSDSSNITEESTALQGLASEISTVEQAVRNKTAAFEAEGATVNQVVESEISALRELSDILNTIQTALQTIFSGNVYNLGNLDMFPDSINDRAETSVFQEIQQTLGQILTVLQGFTGLESDGENSLKHKEPVVDNGSRTFDMSDALVSKLNDISTEGTLVAIKDIVSQIADTIKATDDSELNNNVNSNLNALVSALSANITSLKEVMDGVVVHQKAQKSDTKKAMVRIQDPKQNQIISGLAKSAVDSLGDEAEVESLQALANGLVKVEGAFKNAEGQWEGFTVKINEHNEAVDLAVKKHSSFARLLNKGMPIEDDNPFVFSKDEVEKRAQKHLEEYAAQGKNATVQFKDSGRYTITILEEIDGLSKQIFQTFDENDDKIERTTVTMSNSQKMKLDNLQKKLIENGIANDLISDKDSAYNDYQNASDALNNMTIAYSKLDDISEDQINQWKQQITLVQQLGTQVETLIKQRKLANEQQVFESDRSKKLSKFDLDKASLYSNIDMSKVSKDLVDDIGVKKSAIENATDADSLKIAINNWEALQNQIRAAAVQQDLYIKKTKSAQQSPDQFTKDLTKQKTDFIKYKTDIENALGVGEDLKNQLNDLETRMSSIGNVSDLADWIQEFKNLKTEISNAQKAFKVSQKSKASDIAGQANAKFNKDLNFKVTDSNLTAEQEEIKNKRAELLQQIAEYNIKVESGQEAEISGIEATRDALYQLIDAYKKKYNIASNNSGTKKGQAYGLNQLQTFTARYNSLIADASNVGFDSQATVVANLINAYKQLQTAQSAFVAGEDKTTDVYARKVEVFKAAQFECNKYARELNKVITSSKKLEADSVESDSLSEDFKDDIEGRKVALKDFVNSIYGSRAAIGDFDKKCNELNFTVKNSDGTFTQMTATINQARTAIYATAGATKEMSSGFKAFFGSVLSKFKSIIPYLTASFGWQEIWQHVRQGVTYVKEIDSALTELKKVTNETDATYDRFLQTMSKTAGTVGSTVSELTTMASDWARLGYSIEEAGKLAESTAILLNVSEFQDANAASEALISTMQAFQYTADDSQHVVDILNEVGNNYAVSSDGIATALQDSASALMEAGNNLEQSVALVAAANKVVQDPNSVGSALRTISLRLRGTSVEILESMGEETDGAVESISKMQEKLKALTGVDILTDSGAYKDTYTILKEIAAVWDEMDKMDQAAALELMAGKNRANTLAAILNNIEDLEGAYESALNAEGSAMRENEAYLNSIQGRIDLFNNALQTFWMNLLSTDVIKGVVDAGTALLKFADTFIGKLTAIVATFAIVKRVKDGVKFADMFKGVVSTVKEVYAAIQLMISGTKSLTTATVAQSLASKKVSKELVTEILTKSRLAGVDGKLTKEQIKLTAATLSEAFANGKLTTSQYLATMSTMGLKTALQALWTVLKANPIYAVSAIVTGAALAFDYLHTTAQEAADAAKEAFDEMQNVVESTKSTIQSLESELSTIQEKIDAFDEKKLSFAEEQELDKLKKQREELEHSLRVQEQLLELQRNSSNKQAIASMKAYTKAASEGAKETQDTAKTWGTIGGIILGVAGALLAIPSGGASLGVTAAAIGAGGLAGGVAGNKAGEVIGSSIAENEGTYDSWYETYTKALDAARKDEQDALEEYKKDSSNIDKLDKWQEAKQRVSEIETEMYEHLSQMQQYYSGLDYGVSDEIDKELDTWYNFLDKLSIDQGASGAEVTALDRIFGKNASEEIQLLKEQILDAIKAGEDFDFESAINGSKELKSILDYLGLSVEDVKNYFTQVGEAVTHTTSNIIPVKTHSKLLEDVDNYNDILAQTAEIVTNNTKVTQEYKDSLVELGISEDDLNECFDESNPLIVKNAKALNNLVKAANKNVASNVKLAKSQANLDYYNLVKQLNSTLDSTNALDNATRNAIQSTLAQIDSVKQAIYQYQLLEDSLLGVNNAFDEYNKAKEIDDLNTYGDSYVEMVQTLYDGLYKTGQVGTAQFQAAANAFIPDNYRDSMQEMVDYFNKYIAPTLQLDNDAFSFDFESVENFVEKGLNAGVFTGNLEKFDLVEGMNLKEAARLLQMTEAQVYAMFAELDKYNTDAGENSFLSQLDDSLEGKILNITNDIEDLNRQKLALLEDGGYEKNKAAIDEINAKLAQSEAQLSGLAEDAYTMWQEYTKNDAALAALGEIEDKQRALTKEEANILGIEWDVAKGMTVQQAYDQLLAKQLQLEEPTVLTAQLAIDSIDAQIAELEALLADPKQITIMAQQSGKSVNEIKNDIQGQIDALNEDKAVIATTFGIELDPDDKAALKDELDAIEKFKINDKEFTVIADGTSKTMSELRDIQNYTLRNKSYTVTKYERTAYVGGSSTHTSDSGNTHGGGGGTFVNGTAYANGNFGAPKTETALVGELGPEMLVRNGRWMTIGDNGAEFTQVKKGDIIFNHKQTEELLSKGYVTGRGKAYASGTAYSGLWNPISPDDSLSNKPGNNLSSASGNLSSAAKDVSDAAEEFREVFDWIEVRLEEINEDLDLKSAKLENTIGSSQQNAIVDDMIKLNEKLYENLLAGANKYYAYARTLLAKIPAAYREAAQDGTIAIETFVGEVDEKTLEAIQDYRDWVQKGADATQQAEEVLTEISSLAKQAIDNISDDYENKASIRDSEIDQLDAYNSLSEAKYGAESANIYQEIIKETNNNIKTLQEQRNKMQAELNKQVEAGNIKKYSQDWYDAVNDIAAVDTEIINLTTDTYDYQDSINELHWDAFDNLLSRLEAISDEASNLVDILEAKDMVDEEGNWTDEGITTLGLYAQQMENAEVQSKKYREEIDYLNKNWESLGFTEQEYIEKLDELKSGQYDAIKSYQDTKNAIKDLTSERVDAIKKGIDKEIEAYEELIETKKKNLNAEKEAYDFQRSIEESTTEISDIERKIAALSADTSASARSKRAQLEAELLKAQQELQDKYYDQSIQDQQDALDKELESFQKEKDQEIEGWEEYLANTETVVSDGLAVVQGNTEVIYQTLQGMGQEYSLMLADALTSPWKDGEAAIQSYAEKFGLSMSATVQELQKLAGEYEKITSNTENYGKEVVNQVNGNVTDYQDATKQPSSSTTTETVKTVKVGGKINAGSAKIYDFAGDTSGEKQYYSNDPIYKVLAIDGDWVQVRHHKLSTGVTGWFKKSQVSAYAKGTTGVKEDQLALIDELGEELVMHADGSGKLAFLSKGSAVIPHDISENLMQLGELNPQDILDRNRPVVSAPHITNNNIELNVSFGEVVHIDHVDNNTVPNLAKTVEKQIDKYMKGLNSEIRKYVR